jgi:hypothetical protein
LCLYWLHESWLFAFPFLEQVELFLLERDLPENLIVGGPAQDFPPFVFFLAGTTFFEASTNQNKNKQTSNKERDAF